MNNKIFILLTLYFVTTNYLYSQISKANEDDFNYEHLLLYNFSALVYEGNENKIDDHDRSIIKEYNFHNDYRYIYWNRLPGKYMESYLPWNIEKILRLEFIEEKYIKGNFSLFTFRDCERGLVLQTRLWDDEKTVSLSWEYFERNFRDKSKYLKGCPINIVNKQESNKKLKSQIPKALYKGKKHNEELNKN